VPSLTELRDDNLVYTTDYRRIYATAINKWMGYGRCPRAAAGEFEPLPLFNA